eukprot:scaffold85690_cov29-Tisochrysis_lutea.AAC.3
MPRAPPAVVSQASWLQMQEGQKRWSRTRRAQFRLCQTHRAKAETGLRAGGSEAGGAAVTRRERGVGEGPRRGCRGSSATAWCGTEGDRVGRLLHGVARGGARKVAQRRQWRRFAAHERGVRCDHRRLCRRLL